MQTAIVEILAGEGGTDARDLVRILADTYHRAADLGRL